jgi:polysaccharide biosynthesis transport protein
MKSESKSITKPISNSPDDSDGTLDILLVLSRQRWVIIFCATLGLALGVAYSLKATVWYESTATLLINSKNPTIDANSQTDTLGDDVLANHMEILRSRKIVEGALKREGLMELESITSQLDESENEDAADYVIEHLDIVKGGEGAAKTARSLSLTFTHTGPEESQRILEAVLLEYQEFITGQLESVMSKASDFINQAKDQVESDLREAEQEYLVARKSAPLLFQGEGSSNIYQDKYRRVEEELLNVEIEESSLRTRLERVNETIATLDNSGQLSDHLDKLALIDSESLERLGTFATLQTNAAGTAEFQAAQPARMAEAQTQYENVLELMSEKQRLTTIFGPGHPKVRDVEDQIQLVKAFLAEKEVETKAGIGEGMMSPEALLKAYVGFLNHDIASLTERKRELQILAKDAEAQAKTLIDYELQDNVLQKKIERQEALFDGVVLQLRQLDTASGLTGYVYELLATPRLGVKAWPSLPLCGLGGLMLGLFGGLFLAVANDLADGRFRSAAELEEFVKIPMLGRLGTVNSIKRGVQGLIATELTPDAEAIRMVRTLLLPDIRSGKMRCVGVTSPMQGDGKSTFTANLAVSFSQLKLSVIVVDADLRRPSVHHYFSVTRENGLCEVLTSKLDFSDAIRQTEIANLSVLPAGNATNVPAELLQSEHFDELLEALKDRFDVVLIDMPPVLAVSDPLVIGPKLSGVMVVVRAASARRSEVANTLSRLEAAGSTLIGCALNTFGASKKFSSDGGYYGYYKSSYTNASKFAPAKTNGKLAPLTKAAPASQLSESESENAVESV